MNNKAYINGVEVSEDFAGMYHEVLSKLKLGIELTIRERSFYLLFVASLKEASEFLRKEQENNGKK